MRIHPDPNLLVVLILAGGMIRDSSEGLGLRVPPSLDQPDP